MIKLKINNKEIEVENGVSLLQAANSIGINIPTMCYNANLEHFTSCMVCVVRDRKTGKMLPACSYEAQNGMSIETDSDEVKNARKTALDLLLSEHVGDCEAPCVKTCPAGMNIPLMLSQIESQNLNQAIVTIKNHIPIPAILGRICPAPCEKGCRRTQVDEALSICKLKGFVAEWDAARTSPYLPEKSPSTNKNIAIIGSGPTGLSAAWYLLHYGHSCQVFDDQKIPGGMLRHDDLTAILPKEIIDQEINIIKSFGTEFKQNTKVGIDISAKSILEKYDAVIIACGKIDFLLFKSLGLKSNERGIEINKHTFQTNIEKVFAGGGAVGRTKMAVKSVAHGRQIAISINRFLATGKVDNHRSRFNSRIGKILEIEKENFLRDSKAQRITTNIENISREKAKDEASRCLHCECLKPHDCKLRDYAEQFQAKQSRFKGEDRKEIKKNIEHHSVVYEPGKCIKCGLCVRLTEQSGEKLGLTFIGRGFDVEIGVPLNKSLEKGLTETAKKCVEICPTGALAYKVK